MGYIADMATVAERRRRTVSSVGAFVVLLLVLVFGNEAFTEWVHRHHGRPDTNAGDYLLNVLTFPNWEFFPNNKSNAAWREWFARDLRAVLVVAIVALFLAVGSEALLARGTGAFGGF